MIDLATVTMLDNPPDVLRWPATTTLTALAFRTPDGVHVEADALGLNGRWPDVTPPTFDGPLQYTLGLLLQINGQWFGSAAIQFWRTKWANGGPVLDESQIPRNWYYDGRWGALQSHQPAASEHVGVLVAAGNLRGVRDGSQSPVKERARVVEIVWPSAYGSPAIVWQEGSDPVPSPAPFPNAPLARLLAAEFETASQALHRIGNLLLRA